MENRRWLLARRPEGMVRTDDFRLDEAPIEEPGEGEVVVKTLYLAFDPAMRAWITGADTYVSGIHPGDLMRGMGVGQVVATATRASLWGPWSPRASAGRSTPRCRRGRGPTWCRRGSRSRGPCRCSGSRA